MTVVGRGFLAGYFDRISDNHERVRIIAAGVSAAPSTDIVAFERESRMLDLYISKSQSDDSKIVFLSTASTAMYGLCEAAGEEDDRDLQPHSAYGEHKLALEAKVRKSGCRYLILRLSHVMGPGQRPHQLIPSLLKQITEGSVVVHRGVTRDLIHVEDVVRIVDDLLASGVGETTLNLASGMPIEVEEIVTMICERLGVAPIVEVVDRGVAPNALVSIQKVLQLSACARETGFGVDYYGAAFDRLLAQGRSLRTE